MIASKHRFPLLTCAVGQFSLRGQPLLVSAFRNVRYKFVSQIAGRRDLRVGSVTVRVIGFVCGHFADLFALRDLVEPFGQQDRAVGVAAEERNSTV